MNLEVSVKVKEKESFLKTVFSLPVINWILMIVGGILVPVFIQPYISEIISGLSNQPEIIEGQVIRYGVDDFLQSLMILTIISISFITVFAHQLYLLVKLKTYTSMWLLVLTVCSPLAVWVILPIIF